MPSYQHFEQLPAWQAAANLYNQVLDLLEMSDLPLSRGYRDQIDRAALSVSNNIAEGFDRMSTAELIAFLAIARGSASEVRSMAFVVRRRPTLAKHRQTFDAIAERAGACLRQLSAWISSIEQGPIQGKRHLTGQQKRARANQNAADEIRIHFLQTIPPSHPLYHTEEAQQARKLPPTAFGGGASGA